MEIHEQVKLESIRRLHESHERLVKCMRLLGEERVWLRPNSHVVSVGNLILHLCGNVGQWINSTLGDRPDQRQRQAEFEEIGPLPTPVLETRLASTLGTAARIIAGLEAEDLRKAYSVQGFTESGTAILLHVVEHFSYHTGQVTLHTKLLLDMDTGYYAGQDLDQKN